MGAVADLNREPMPCATLQALRDLVVQLPVAVALLDPDMRYVAASAPFLRDFRARDIRGRGDRHLFPRDIERWQRAYRRCLRGRIERCEEDLFELADGSPHWRSWEARPWRDEAGRIIGVLLHSENVTERKLAREAAEAAERERDTEIDVSDRLRRLAHRTVCDAELPALLLEILDTGMAITAADFGTMQLVDPDRSTLSIAAQRGFCPAWVQFWNGAGQHLGSSGACLARGERIVIEDVEQSEVLADPAALRSLLEAGVRAVQSTPLVTRSGTVLGVLSTHHRAPQRPGDRVLGRLDRLARLAADCIESLQARAAQSRNEARLHALVSATSYALYIMSPDWSELRELRGQGFLVDKTRPSRNWLEEYIEPEDRAHVMQAVRTAIETRSTFALMNRVRRADGSIGWTWSRAVPLLDSRGEIIEWFGAASDMTEQMERKRAELELRTLNSQLEQLIDARTAALRRSEARLQAILDAISDAVVTVNESGQVMTFNRAAQRLFGYDSDEIVGRDFGVLFGSGDSSVHEAVIGSYTRARAQSIVGRERKLNALHRDGHRRPVALTFNAIDHLGLFAACIRDLAQTRALEDEVLNRALLEQQRIGQELHDGTQQELSGLGLLAHTLAERLSRGRMQDCAALAARIASGLSESAANVRRLAHGLVPFQLDASDLPWALTELAHRTSREHGIACVFASPEPVAVQDSQAATHLYRIAQEAVTNSVRHAEARRISVQLTQADGSIILQIADDGVGIELHSSSFRGAGMRLMEHRSSVLGGYLEVGRRDGGGTVIRAVIPSPEPA